MWGRLCNVAIERGMLNSINSLSEREAQCFRWISNTAAVKAVEGGLELTSSDLPPAGGMILTENFTSCVSITIGTVQNLHITIKTGHGNSSILRYFEKVS